MTVFQEMQTVRNYIVGLIGNEKAVTEVQFNKHYKQLYNEYQYSFTLLGKHPMTFSMITSYDGYTKEARYVFEVTQNISNEIKSQSATLNKATTTAHNIIEILHNNFGLPKKK